MGIILNSHTADTRLRTPTLRVQANNQKPVIELFFSGYSLLLIRLHTPQNKRFGKTCKEKLQPLPELFYTPPSGQASI